MKFSYASALYILLCAVIVCMQQDTIRKQRKWIDGHADQVKEWARIAAQVQELEQQTQRIMAVCGAPLQSLESRK